MSEIVTLNHSNPEFPEGGRTLPFSDKYGLIISEYNFSKDHVIMTFYRGSGFVEYTLHDGLENPMVWGITDGEHFDSIKFRLATPNPASGNVTFKIEYINSERELPQRHYFIKMEIWGKLELDNGEPDIVRELTSQADLLADKTHGILYAEVIPTDAYDEKTMELAVIYDFYVYAPYLGNQRWKLFTVAELRKQLILIDRINNPGEKHESPNIVDLRNNIQKIIFQSNALSLIQNAYNSSKKFLS